MSEMTLASRLQEKARVIDSGEEITFADEVSDDYLEAAAALDAARELIRRYRHETPLGHQPHMIAHKADEWLSKIEGLSK